jgi:hypothetical protein
MKIVKFCLITSLAFGLPFAAAAQQNVAKATPSDIQYCHALSHAYSSMWSSNEGMPVAEAFSLGQCDTDTQKTIATLEKRMKDQKIELPPRQGVAQAPGSTDEHTGGMH